MADPLDRFRPTSQTLARSVLDRLLDPDPDLAVDHPKTIGAQLSEFREGLRRDLESLFNTRCRPVTPPKELPELAGSLLDYGVEGYFLTALITDDQRQRFARGLEQRIRQFEPRLDEVDVSVAPNRNPNERSLRLRIEARCVLQPGMPPIVFESSVDPSTQRISVEGQRG